MAQNIANDCQSNPTLRVPLTIPERRAQFFADVAKTYRLLTYEYHWRDRALWLESQGYKLRPRYQPGWKPDIPTGENLGLGDENHAAMARVAIVDAIRTKDNKRVLLKRIVKSDHPFEVDITRLFSTEPLSSDPHNHCVQLLDTIHPPNEPDITILVLPFLQQLDASPFDTFGEIVDFIRQIFIGLQYMHHHHVAHRYIAFVFAPTTYKHLTPESRDIGVPNVMMDGDQMFPEGWHHLSGDRTPRGEKHATFFTRTQRPPKYYIIDFGLSHQYDPSDTNPLQEPVLGGDKSVPEFQTNKEAFNPFQTDIYYIGNLIRRLIMKGDGLLLKGYFGAGFLQPLIKDMVRADPEKRPTIDEVVVRFEKICKKLSVGKLRSRPIPRKGNIIKGIRNHMDHRKRMKEYIGQGLPVIPSWQSSAGEEAH